MFRSSRPHSRGRAPAALGALVVAVTVTAAPAFAVPPPPSGTSFNGCAAWSPQFEPTCSFVTKGDFVFFSTGAGRWTIDVYRNDVHVEHYQDDATWAGVMNAVNGDRVVLTAYAGRNNDPCRLEAHSLT